MFNRPAKAKNVPRSTDTAVVNDAGGARRGPRVASLITDELTIEGDLSGDGELQVDCLIRGDVSVSRLSIGETGRIVGAVTAEVVEVRGAVTGSITAKQVRLYATARLEGDVTHEQLTIEPGARFEGRSLRLNPEAAAPPAAVTSGD